MSRAWLCASEELVPEGQQTGAHGRRLQKLMRERACPTSLRERPVRHGPVFQRNAGKDELLHHWMQETLGAT